MTVAERNDSTIFERAMREASSLALTVVTDSAQRRAQAVRENQSVRRRARSSRIAGAGAAVDAK